MVLHFEGDYSELEARFKGIVERSENFRPWFEEVFIPTFHEVEHRHFDSEGGYLGASALWSVPYSEDYASYKELLKGHLIKEVLHEKLIDSLVGDSGDESVLEVSESAVRVGTDVVNDEGYGYAQVQQEGAPTVLGRTYDRDRKPGSKKRGARPSENKKQKKASIPPRPIVLGSWPQPVLDETADSIVKYLIYGEIAPVVGF